MLYTDYNYMHYEIIAVGRRAIRYYNILLRVFTQSIIFFSINHQLTYDAAFGQNLLELYFVLKNSGTIWSLDV